MLTGHGDDLHNYPGIRSNFSSNVYAGFSHQGLFEHLKHNLHLLTNYPEPSPLSLEQRLAESHQIASDNIMVTNGATEAIYLIARTFQDHHPNIPQPTFAEYADACRWNKGKKEIWWLCIPNNPSGHVLPHADLLCLIDNNPDDIFILDLSYAAYTLEPLPAAADVVTRRNVLMLRSMTKDYGIPGLRLGYLIGNRELVQRIAPFRMPWSVNAMAIEAGHYLLRHAEDYRIPIQELIHERHIMEHELKTLGITTAHSDSHILLGHLPQGDATSLKDYLAHQHGILIRDASNFATLTPQHFRLAMQTPSQNLELINALRQWIS